jgi:hypothetical protein
LRIWGFDARSRSSNATIRTSDARITLGLVVLMTISNKRVGSFDASILSYDARTRNTDARNRVLMQVGIPIPGLGVLIQD